MYFLFLKGESFPKKKYKGSLFLKNYYDLNYNITELVPNTFSIEITFFIGINVN